MSPREVFALRDYLGRNLKGRTISDARQAGVANGLSWARPAWQIASANFPGDRC